MDNNKVYFYYLLDTISALKEEYYKILEDMNSTVNMPDSDPGKSFIQGEGCAYYCALETIRNQAISFQLPLKEIGLEDEIPLLTRPIQAKKR